ncbi:MAG: DUF5320 domain-containing protein [Thermodesulfobacteriota bacterium]|nr:DUF5320 domain-containing protein [Thermodesulfobacteriota bacterium]
MTGRRAGFCVGNEVPGYTNQYSGGGFRGGNFRGGGGPWGRRNRFFANGSPYGAYGNVPFAPAGYNEKAQIDALRQQADYLETTLEATNKKIADMEKEKKE